MTATRIDPKLFRATNPKLKAKIVGESGFCHEYDGKLVKVWGQSLVFSGGSHGSHSLSIETTNFARAWEHWEGYCHNNGCYPIPPGLGTPVLIEKTNCGVHFKMLTPTGKPVKSASADRTTRALYGALDWYGKQLAKVCEARQFDNYNLQIRDRWYFDRDPKTPGAMMPFEPWGFAHGEWPNVSMKDTGSTATDGRAKTLACFQAPLDHVVNGPYHSWGKVIRV